MDFFEQLKKNVVQAGQTVADKAKKTTDILKLKEQIRQDKRNPGYHLQDWKDLY